jgi:hypothetical protein
MSATEAVHRRVEQLAAALLDMAPAAERDPAVLAGAAAFAAVQARNMSTLDAAAVRYAEHHGTARVVAYERGRPLALMQATLADVVLGRDRPPITWCAHRSFIDTRPAFIVAALRFAGCPTCVQERTSAAAAELEHDTQCDVCGADHGLVTERVVPFAYATASVYTGPCCDQLFDYAAPVVTRTYMRAQRVGRNDPCPCGCGRKAKRCASGKAA